MEIVIGIGVVVFFVFETISMVKTIKADRLKKKLQTQEKQVDVSNVVEETTEDK